MYITVLKLFLPYLLRYLAGRAANYINTRRNRRLAALKESEPLSEECQRLPPADSQRAVWFGLSGILIGSAFGFTLARLIEYEQ